MAVQIYSCILSYKKQMCNLNCKGNTWFHVEPGLCFDPGSFSSEHRYEPQVLDYGNMNQGMYVLTHFITSVSFSKLCILLLSSFSLSYQTQDTLNPNNLEYWMEDIYTPGYDSLLKRKEAEFRRAKVCKIGALIAAATCTVILVIVVPICTMKTWEHQDGVTLTA